MHDPLMLASDPQIRSEETRAAILALVVAVVLLAVKFLAYYLTRSTAIFSDALESIVNVLASSFALYSVVLAHAPADEQHPYGHGKVEFLAAGFEGGMIFVAAIVILVRAIDDLLHGSGPGRIDIGIALVVIAMLVNGMVGAMLIARSKRHGSITLEADGRHLITDAVTSAFVIVGLMLVRFTGLRWADPLAAILVAIYIAITAIKLLRRSAAGLMDEQDLEDDRVLKGILDSHLPPTGKQPLICSYHKLRHRHSGRYHWVDFHIMVPADWNIDDGHRVASSIEYEIEKSLGQGNATAHVEPCDDPKCEVCAK